MGNWAKYGKQYSKKWENDPILKPWIQSEAGDATKAFCRHCKCEIRAHHADLQRHAATTKHKQNAAKLSSARTLFGVGCSSKQVDNTEKITELKLAAHIACHSSIATVDYLGEIIKNISGKDISLHRTKCSALIKKALSPAVHDELLTDLKDQPYSLIIDESTNTGMEKQLSVVVRYYSQLKKCIVTTFLGIIALESGTAEGIFNVVVQFLDTNKLQVEKCIGLATDGCNVMCGTNNSVITKFKQCVQGLFTSGAYAILYSYALHMHLKLCHATLNSWLQRHTTGSVTVLVASRNTSNYTLLGRCCKSQGCLWWEWLQWTQWFCSVHAGIAIYQFCCRKGILSYEPDKDKVQE